MNAAIKPNGQLKQFPAKPTHDPAFTDLNPVDEQPTERYWRRIQFGEFHPSVNPNAPPAYLLEVQGQRSDDVVFTVKVALSKQKVDMVPSAQMTLRIVRDAMQNALNQLQTFRDCACTIDVACEAHKI